MAALSAPLRPGAPIALKSNDQCLGSVRSAKFPAEYDILARWRTGDGIALELDDRALSPTKATTHHVNTEPHRTRPEQQSTGIGHVDAAPDRSDEPVKPDAVASGAAYRGVVRRGDQIVWVCPHIHFTDHSGRACALKHLEGAPRDAGNGPAR